MKDVEIMKRCGKYFKWLTHGENTEIETDDGVANHQGMTNIRFEKKKYMNVLDE